MCRLLAQERGKAATDHLGVELRELGRRILEFRNLLPDAHRLRFDDGAVLCDGIQISFGTFRSLDETRRNFHKSFRTGTSCPLPTKPARECVRQQMQRTRGAPVTKRAHEEHAAASGGAAAQLLCHLVVLLRGVHSDGGGGSDKSWNADGRPSSIARTK